MKTTPLLSNGLLLAFFSVRVLAATEVVADRNPEPSTARQFVGQNASKHARADAILQAVLDDAKDGLPADKPSGRPAEPVPISANPDAVAAQATYSVMLSFFPETTTDLDAWLAQTLTGIDDSVAAIAAGKKWGEHVARVVLAEQGDVSSRSTASFAESVQSSPAPASVSVVREEQMPIGPGRYRYTVLAGTPGAYGYVNATGTKARFDNLGGIATDAEGNVYVSERNMCTIRKISPDGAVITFAGAAGQLGSQDGAGAAARFNGPSGLAVDADGNVYVADTGNQLVRKIDPAGNVTTLAGKAGESGSADGSRDSARLFNPTFLAVDTAGNVFATEFKNYAPLAQNPIRKIAPDGTVSSLTVEGVDQYSVNEGPICADQAGNLYAYYYRGGPAWEVADLNLLTPTDMTGKYEASLLASSFVADFDELIIMSMDGAGNLYLGAGNLGVYSGASGFHFHVYTPGIGWQDRYAAANSDIHGMAQFTVGTSGELYFLTDHNQGAVGIGIFDPNATGPVITEQPWPNYSANTAGHPLSGNPVTFEMAAVGGPGLTCQWYFNSTPINGVTTVSWVLNNVQKSNEGYYWAVVTDADGSVTSNRTQLVVGEAPSQTPGGGGSLPVTGPTYRAAASSGGGSFHPVTSLAIFLLLTAAALSERRTFNVAAVGTRGMKERA